MSRTTIVALALALVTAGAWAQNPAPSPSAEYDTAPKNLRTSRLTYPRNAFKNHVQGTVVLELTIDTLGRVSAARVVQSIPGLDEAALESVKTWVFEPALKDGHPVVATTRAPLTFGIGLGVGGLPVSALQSPSEVEEGRSLRFTNFRLKGASSAAWLGTLRSEVEGHWTVSKHLHSGPPRTVKIEFVVERNGRISKVRRVAPDARLLAADPALLELDSSAEKALHAARLPPLPPDSGSERLTMQALFTVAKPSPRADEPSNAEPAADQPASAAPEAPPPVDEAWARSHGLVPDYDQPPQPIDIAGPDYPKGALAKRIEGTVLVDLAIDARGHVADARVAQSIPALDTAAIECVKRWRFEPARKAGKPVGALGRAPVVFRVPPPMPGIFSPPSPGEDGPHLMVVGFESGGANLMRWFSDLETEVYAHWKAPDRLRSGPSRSVTYAFEVARDGELSKIRKSDAPAVEDPDWLELQLAGHVRFLPGRSVPS